jgi:quinohemoprotein ethanol dehydrogenase
MRRRLHVVTVLSCLALSGCHHALVRSGVSDQDLRQADPREWLSYGGSYDEQRHSGLTQITPGNVARLGVAWTYEMRGDRGVEATPIIANGVMYVTSGWSIVHALDAASGKELWVYDPHVDRANDAKGCCDAVNRGVAVFGDKVFVGVYDGRLEALDARTGKLVWSVATVDPSRPYTITGAPRVADGLVLIGNGGAELGVRGYLSAYEAATGRLVWRFYTTPNPDKRPDHAASDDALARFANASWGDSGEWRKSGGGGTVWDSIVYDQVNDQIIFGVGNASPWNADFRDPDGKGDNLFLASIVAVDARTGKYKWHFQETPRDEWDYTATQSIVLADLPLGPGGAARRVVMQAPKNGFFYILDAKTGAFLSARAYAPQNWNSGIDAQGRPRIVPAARYGGEHSFVLRPGTFGAHGWHPMAFDPDLGLAFIPSQNLPMPLIRDPRFASSPTKFNVGVDLGHDFPLRPGPGFDAAMRASSRARLIAWDPIKGAPRWTVDYDTPISGGLLSTATGLVFQGTLKGDFLAYDAANGHRLWSTALHVGVTAAPVTYEIDGSQYVAVATGWGTAFGLFGGFAFEDKVAPIHGRVVVFKLDGTGKVPQPAIPAVDATAKAKPFGDAATLELGRVQFHRNCLVCHGVMAESTGVIPDLRWSPVSASREAWQSVVLDGVLKDAGMVSFRHEITPAEAEAIRAYVVDRANQPQK